MHQTPSNRLSSMGISLPPAPTPVAAYIPAVTTGNLVFVSGQLPLKDGSLLAEGPVPASASVEDATAATRQCALNALAVVASELDGDLDRITRIVRLGVFVCCDSSFTQQPAVANGASELLGEIFGDAGRHARAAVGCIALPLGASVELEMIAEVAT